METLLQPDSGPRPVPSELNAQARGLFAAGWYATRDEGRVVHPADQTEQIVSMATWRSLRELGTAGNDATTPAVA
ncbi:hypothetical protein [Ramlibacter sp.]|uniref:hypothetical protein n=1 Tax=Ramlibacter sp. TaxID=1917967 RepID=UPI002FCA3711